MINNQNENIRKTLKELAIYSSFSILGPIVFFLSIGIFLDNYFQKKILFKLSLIGISFVVTNILLFRKSQTLKKKIKKTDFSEIEK